MMVSVYGETRKVYASAMKQPPAYFTTIYTWRYGYKNPKRGRGLEISQVCVIRYLVDATEIVD